MKPKLLLIVIAIGLEVCDAFAMMSMSAASAKHILFDVPVSNNGGKCRIIAYKVSKALL